jgi:hypothetical protein
MDETLRGFPALLVDLRKLLQGFPQRLTRDQVVDAMGRAADQTRSRLRAQFHSKRAKVNYDKIGPQLEGGLKLRLAIIDRHFLRANPVPLTQLSSEIKGKPYTAVSSGLQLEYLKQDFLSDLERELNALFGRDLPAEVLRAIGSPRLQELVVRAYLQSEDLRRIPVNRVPELTTLAIEDLRRVIDERASKSCRERSEGTPKHLQTKRLRHALLNEFLLAPEPPLQKTFGAGSSQQLYVLENVFGECLVRVAKEPRGLALARATPTSSDSPDVFDRPRQDEITLWQQAIREGEG